MADLFGIGGTVARRRQFAYVAMFAALFFAFLYLRDSTWRGDIELHTLMETVATVLSLAVGCLALVRYYSKKDNTFLFIGTGFVATAFLDGYHAVVSSSHFIALFPSTPPSLIAWSWFASRIFLSLLLWLSWLFWRREDRLGAAGLISEKLVYGTVTALALACFAVVAFVPLPAAYYQQLPFPRPQEFAPALFFLLALIGYLRKGKWKTDAFEHWLVLSLIVGFMGQAMFMSFSGRLFDMMFDAAHLLKAGSYICVMVGLLFSMQRLFSESLAQRELAFTNTLLATQQEVSPDAILVVDEQGKIISYNSHFVELWGLTQEMVTARVDEPVLQSVVAQVRDPEAFLARVDRLYQHRSEDGHDEIVLRDGRIIDRYSAPLLGADGKYYGRIWFFRDISERKHAEQLVIDERIFSDTIIASQPDLFYVLDSTGRFIRWNEKLKDILGLTDTQLAASDALAVIYEEDRPAAAQKLQEAFEQGAAYIDARVITKAGIRDYSLRSTRADTAKGAHLVGIGTDITERKQAQSELLQSELAYRTLAQNLPGMVYRVFVREGERMQFYNAMPVQITGYAADELTTGTVCSIEPLILDEDRPGVMAEVRSAIAEERAFAVEYRLKHKDGGIRWMAEHGMPVYGTDGAPLYIDGVIFDITEHKQAEIELRLFRTLVDNSSDALEVLDPATLRLLDVNETQCRELGYSREELLSMKITDIDPALNGDLLKVIEEEIRKAGAARFESVHRRKDGSTFPVEVSSKLVELDKPYALNISRDITKRNFAAEEVLKLQEQLREQALHDPLTGLYNRRYLDESMGREMIRAERYGRPIGIVMCDIDHFKVVNDTYGHLVGDEILRIFAELLKKNSRGSDIVCRFGGEEFLLLLPDMPPDIAYQRAEKLRISLAALPIGKEAIRVTASFGVAAFPENGKTQDALIHAADVAMYQAKEAGRNRVVASSARAADGSAHR